MKGARTLKLLSRLFALIVLTGGLLATTPSSPAPQSGGASASTITVDGSQRPQDIPTWILWECFFRLLNAKWDRQPGMAFSDLETRIAIMHTEFTTLIETAQAVRKDTEDIRRDVINLIATRKATMHQMKAMDARHEAAILDHRNRLADALGPERFAVLERYLYEYIAPGIVVGEFSR